MNLRYRGIQYEYHLSVAKTFPASFCKVHQDIHSQAQKLLIRKSYILRYRGSLYITETDYTQIPDVLCSLF